MSVGAVTTAIGALQIAGVKYNSQIENYETSFKVMTGSAEKAKETIEKLRKMGAETPFELTDLAETTQLLMNYNFTADEAIDRMSMLGDISQGNADKLNRVAMAYGQMSSANKVALEDVKQMIEAGFNPLQEISQTTGESMASLYQRISKGTISVDEITASMQRSTSEGGKYFQSMTEQSKTVTGQLSTMNDNWDSFTGAVAKSTSSSLKNSVLPQINEALEESIEMVENGALDEINGFVESLGSFVAKTIPKLVSGTKSILDNADLIKAAVVGIGSAMVAHKATMTAFVAIEKWSAAKTVVDAYSAALVANQTTAWAGATANTLLASTMTTAQLAVGVLTGKMSLATAAMVTWNKVVAIATSPTGIAALVAGVAALTAGVITYAATHKSAASEIAKAHDEAIKSIEENITTDMAQAETANVLKNRLFELENQINSGKLADEDATAAKEEFNRVAEELNEIVPGIIDNIETESGAYVAQRGEIDALTQSFYNLAYAKAMTNAYQAKIDQTAKDLADVKEELKPYDNGEKSKVYDKGLMAGVQNTTYTQLLNQKKELEDEIQSYATEMQAYKAEMEKYLKSSDLGGSGGGNNNGNGSGGLSDSVKKQTQEISKEFEKQYKNLKRSLEREKITRADYYKDLKNLRDEYLTQGSDEWQKYTEELAEFTEDTFDDCVDKLKEFKDEVHKKIKDLKEEQAALKESLMPDKSPVEFGTINGEAYVSLANYDKELYQLQRYGALLDELFEKRGDLPQFVVDELKEMDTEQAMQYMSALINASDPQYNALIQVRQKLEEEAAENSAKLMSAEAEEMKRILEEKFGELPEDFFELGDESASAFGDGFLNELSAAMETVRQTIMSEMSTISNAAVASFAASVGTGATSVVHNNYNSSYTFNSSKDTTTQQLRAAQNAASLDRLRGNI